MQGISQKKSNAGLQINPSMSVKLQFQITKETKIAAASKALACIIVTYYPKISILARQIESLPTDAAVVIVDNASGRHSTDELQKLISTRQRANLLTNAYNQGLAAAINKGIKKVCRVWPETRFALLLDQDSEPQAGSIEALLKGFTTLEASGITVGCVGPSLLDIATGLYHGFHQHDRWRWKRVFPESGNNEPIPCANLNGSGTLVPIDLFLKLGGLEEGLFIDHVDTEWAFRVTATGYGLFGIPNAVFEHRMGDDSRRIWLFGWRTWPMRSAQRHYYLFRNATILMCRNYVPLVWKIWAVIKLLLTACIHGLTDPQRWAQLRCMLRGFYDGLTTRKMVQRKAIL